MRGEAGMSWGLVDLFSDRENVSITARLQHGSTGIVEFTERPEQDHPTSLLGGDLGRMMLIDEYIFDQGIVTNNRQQMDAADARLVLSNVGDIRT